MDNVIQIRSGKHMIGIIGLRSAPTEAVTRCKGLSNDHWETSLFPDVEVFA